jgi:AraC-like DNA-binding protein
MESNGRRELIEVFRPHDLPQLELRRGVDVVRPVPRHWHEEYQLCFTQAGAGELKYRGSNIHTPSASLFMVHPGEVHANRCYDSFGVSYRMMFVDSELMRRAAEEVYGKESGLPYFPTALTFDEDVIRQYLDLHSALDRPASALERQSLLLNLLTTLITRFAENRPSPRAFGSERQAVTRACEYLVEHYAENVSLESLARIANLSPYHFNRVFSEQFGMPPHAFQTQLRVMRAKDFLRQGWPIPQVACQTGFADQSHLTRHFKRLAVATPGQYIQNSKNVQDGF